MQALGASEPYRAGPEAEIESAVASLIAACSRPPWMDEDTAIDYEAALIKACWEYPLDVVQSACENWRRVPGQGRWWPTEADLRAQCNPLFASRKALRDQAKRLFNALEADEDRREFEKSRADASVFADDKSRKFREAMRERFLTKIPALKTAPTSKFDACFHPLKIKYSVGGLILVRSDAQRSMLYRYGSDLIEEFGLSIRYDPMAFEKDPPPRYDEDPPEVKAEIAAKMKVLRAALAAGADLRPMLDKGII